MAKVTSNFTIDSRRLLTSAAAAATATGVAPHLPSVDAAEEADRVQAAMAAPDPLLNVSAGMARRLLEIARRNAIRREAGLPLLAPIQELRRMKKVEMEQEFDRFAAAHSKAVLEALLKRRREEEGDPNWKPRWAEGVAIGSRVRHVLMEEVKQARRAAT